MKTNTDSTPETKVNDSFTDTDCPMRTCAVVYLDRLVKNMEEIHKKLKDETPVIAVIKTDGYGHGALPIAQELQALPYIWGYAVATVEEALELRDGGICKPILILGYTFEKDYPVIVQEEIRPTVFSYEMARQISECAIKAGKAAFLHLALDTGMSRIGFRDSEESISEIKKISGLPGIVIEGLFTHFARADELDKSNATNQLERFKKFAGYLETSGVHVPLRHCANSAGIMEMPMSHMDAVRSGIITYGIYPSDEVDRQQLKLLPVMEWKSHIVYIKEVPAGVPVSYGGTFVTEHTTRIATIPVGYGDGYPRSLSNQGYVLIHGKKAPVLGRVCMDQFMVDVTDIPCRELDEVTLMGTDGGEELSVDLLGRMSGRFPYEFVCDIGKRVPRIYVKR